MSDEPNTPAATSFAAVRQLGPEHAIVPTILDHIERGRDVLVSGDLHRCMTLFDRVLSSAAPGSGVVAWSRSNRSIEHSGGGQVCFFSTDLTAGRGRSADTVIVLSGRSFDERVDSLTPCLRASASPVLLCEWDG